MISIVFLILGIAGLAVPEAFQGQNVIATVLLIVGAALLAIQIVGLILIKNKVEKTRREFNRRFHDRSF